MKVLLVGGGSGGPVSPLLAVADEIKQQHPGARFLLVGTRLGSEKSMAEAAQIPFQAISAGKWRRYFSLKNLATPIQVLLGFFQSVSVLGRFRPDAVFGTGSFVQVGVVWAAWLKGIPVILHQQDVYPSLANRICQMCAKRITVTFPPSLKDFNSGSGLFFKKPEDKIILTGNPFRHNLRAATRAQGQQEFQLEADFPTLFVMGGGTGSEFLNTLVAEALPELVKTVQIIQATGNRKKILDESKRYHPYEFIANPGAAYAAADLVLARAGLSTITELSHLGKIAIIVPMPRSHQIINASLLQQRQAAVVCLQAELSPAALVRLIKKILFDGNLQQTLTKNISTLMPAHAGRTIADIIIKQALAYAE